MNLPKIRLVCATRATREAFLTDTALGRSCKVYGFLSVLEVRLFAENRAGLPSVYNQAIREAKDKPALLVFIHDDVHLVDFYWSDHLISGLQSYQILGVAGNKRRVPRQPAWAFVDDKFTWDARENLSGIVGHGTGFPCQNLSVFGPPNQQVKTLDGVMLAAHSETLHQHQLFFDERFDFHFYDVDFCRQAEAKQLSMGTYPISLVHESGGAFGTPAWRAAYQKYLEKWGD
jgi:GT2 family glycosyltransferase